MSAADSTSAAAEKAGASARFAALTQPFLSVVIPTYRRLDLLQRVGRGHRPVAAHRQPGPVPDQVAERELQTRAVLPQERDGQVIHLRFALRPVRLAVGDHAELGEPGDVLWLDELQMLCRCSGLLSCCC